MSVEDRVNQIRQQKTAQANRVNNPSSAPQTPEQRTEEYFRRFYPTQVQALEDLRAMTGDPNARVAFETVKKKVRDPSPYWGNPKMPGSGDTYHTEDVTVARLVWDEHTTTESRGGHTPSTGQDYSAEVKATRARCIELRDNERWETYGGSGIKLSPSEIEEKIAKRFVEQQDKPKPDVIIKEEYTGKVNTWHGGFPSIIDDPGRDKW